MKILLPILFLFLSTHLFSQELNCRVNIYSGKVSGTDKQVFKTMQTAVFEFMNNTKWTEAGTADVAECFPQAPAAE